MSTTAFGSAWTEPNRAAAVLRAQASDCAALERVAAVDAAAAVIAAHLWAAALGESTLQAAHRHRPGDQAAAAAVLARAAGHGCVVPHGWFLDVDVFCGPRTVDAAFAAAVAWLDDDACAAVDSAAALTRAAFDLAAGLNDAQDSVSPSVAYACMLLDAEATGRV